MKIWAVYIIVLRLAIRIARKTMVVIVVANMVTSPLRIRCNYLDQAEAPKVETAKLPAPLVMIGGFT